MQTDWSALGRVSPASLVEARVLAHHAVQWATKAARANIDAVPDDSHSSLGWDASLAVLESQPLPAKQGSIRVAIRLTDLRLVIVRDRAATETFAMNGKTDAEAGAWIDTILRTFGLRPASSVTLPYSIPNHAVDSGAAYVVDSGADALQELSRWYGAAAEVLEIMRGKLGKYRPGPSLVRCWPHHFDIAVLVQLEEGHSESARSIGIGLSPGDEYYAQPYMYVSPWPRLDVAGLPAAPSPGHWHTQGFVAAVATGEEILKLADRSRGLCTFASDAFDIGRARLGA